ncbi:MAG: ribosome-associated translation inhibitor RaiA [Ignavibacteria bacterium]|nr:ribosome-associated translation inhibitor RaiA [Ignavibacteria bacterium]
MIINVTARHFKAWPELHELVVDAANGFLKYNESITRTDIVLSEENDKFIEFTVHVNSHTFHGEATGADFDKALHGASDKIVAQLRKLKEKMTNHKGKDVPEFLG